MIRPRLYRGIFQPHNQLWCVDSKVNCKLQLILSDIKLMANLVWKLHKFIRMINESIVKMAIKYPTEQHRIDG